MTAPVTTGTCADCPHEHDEHIGASSSCVAFVVEFGRERVCYCTGFEPEDPAEADNILRDGAP
ncbi:hypothetical protein BTO20_20190 [Mycobacterium dioxanotrophicus]|uniref:Ferredoxin n=1 Tax=Mycobacterium dioxanotrophicus TaxID=482462 RepID=A0A1Y0C5R2_9MYCO|nr:hypothetical protein [Mycobacterium dioxanotrophicus]ART70549.1 hypothetical protein BTO20_20190 [Mycobacterium dioxanotrophicus]